jgi:hypothetical protein
MAKVDKINGVYKINTIITTEGDIPTFGNVRGPLLIPRLMDEDIIKVLLFYGIELRAVERNVIDYKIEDTLVLTPEKVDELINEFKNGPVKKEEPKVEVPKQEVPKKEEPKQEVPKKEEPKVEVPKQEAPKKEEPKVEVPKQEAPKVDEKPPTKEDSVVNNKKKK